MINLDTLQVLDTPSIEEGFRFLRTQFRDNVDRYEGRFVEPLYHWLCMNGWGDRAESTTQFYRKSFARFKPYSPAEAFAIQDSSFRALVFSVINVPEMIRTLGTNRVKTEGIELVNRVWDDVAEAYRDVPMTQVYELHEVNGEKLGVTESIYAIKCWCTSTDEEHWLWTQETSSPLRGIANTCMVYPSMLGKIESIIRQGDVFIFELKEEINLKVEEEAVPLPPEIYFKLLKSQS